MSSTHFATFAFALVVCSKLLESNALAIIRDDHSIGFYFNAHYKPTNDATNTTFGSLVSVTSESDLEVSIRIANSVTNVCLISV
jgi:hypothetical protein